MKTIIFLIVISLVSAQEDYNTYICKTDGGTKGIVHAQGEYKKGDTIWLDNCKYK